MIYRFVFREFIDFFANEVCLINGDEKVQYKIDFILIYVIKFIFKTDRF